MAETTTQSDKALGLGLVFGLLAVVGAGGMFLYGSSGAQALSGWSLALAVVAGSLAVVSIHVFS